MLQTLLEEIEKRFESNKTEQTVSYASMVRECVSNEREPDPDELAAVLHDTGKSIMDFTSDCLKYKTRIGLREQLDEIPEAKNQLEGIKLDIESKRSELEKINKEYGETISSLARERDELQQVVLEEGRIRRELLDGCWDDSLSQKVKQLHSEKVDVSKKLEGRSPYIRNLNEQIRMWENRIRGWKSEYGNDTEVWSNDMQEKHLDACESLEALREKLAEQSEVCSELEGELSRIDIDIQEVTDELLMP